MPEGKSRESANKSGALENRAQELPIVFEKDGDYYNIRNVDIVILGKEGGDPEFDQKFATKAIANFEDAKLKGHLPTVFLGHNDFTSREEKPAIGRLDNLFIQNGKLYADIVRVKADLIDTIKDEYPSRSIEYDPSRPYITGLALLGSREPFYHLRQFSADGAVMVKLCDNGNKAIIYNTNLRSMFIEDEANQPVEEVEAEEEVVVVENDEVEETEEPVEEAVESEEEESDEAEEEESDEDDEEPDDEDEEVETKAQLAALQAKVNTLNQELRGRDIEQGITTLVKSKKITAAEAKLWKPFMKNVSRSKEQAIFEILKARPVMKAFEELGHGEEVSAEDVEVKEFNEKVNTLAKEKGISTFEAYKELNN